MKMVPWSREVLKKRGRPGEWGRGKNAGRVLQFALCDLRIERISVAFRPSLSTSSSGVGFADRRDFKSRLFGKNLPFLHSTGSTKWFGCQCLLEKISVRMLRSKWPAAKARGGRIPSAGCNRPATQAPVHFQRNPWGGKLLGHPGVTRSGKHEVSGNNSTGSVVISTHSGRDSIQSRNASGARG